MSTASRFPDHVFLSGPRPLKLVVREQKYPVGELIFEDGSIETNLTSPCGRLELHFEYDGLDTTEGALLDAHFAEAQGKTRTFLCYDYHNERLYEGCRYVSYQKPAHRRYWSSARRIVIVKEPS